MALGGMQLLLWEIVVHRSHSNLYRGKYSKTSRPKTLPRSHDRTGMSIISGLRLIRPESMLSGDHFLQADFTRLIPPRKPG
jgi:hypothetical protein